MLTPRKITQLINRFLTREAGDLQILGLAEGDSTHPWWDDTPVAERNTVPIIAREILAEVEGGSVGTVISAEGDRAVVDLHSAAGISGAIRRLGRAARTASHTIDRSSPQHVEFDRRQAIRRSLSSVFDYSMELISSEERGDVARLRIQIITDGNCDMIHNGNKAILKALLKTHPLSNVEQMRLDEMKVVAVALFERDEVTIQTIVDTARRRRNG